MADNNKLNEMMEGSLSKIRELAKTDTVIGDPIVTSSGTTIIPVSKVTMGFVSGGLDYDGKITPANGDASRFGGGGGTGISVTPIAFLTILPDGRSEVIPIDGPTDTLDKISALLDKAPDLLSRFKDAILSKKDAKKQEKEAAAAEAAPDATTEAEA